MRVDTPFGTGAANGSLPMKVDADLTRARIDNLLPGWSKPAGKSGSLTFTLVEQNGFNLSDIVLMQGPQHEAARGWNLAAVSERRADWRAAIAER